MAELDLPAKASPALEALLKPLVKSLDFQFREARTQAPQLTGQEAGRWLLFFLSLCMDQGRQPSDQEISDLWNLVLDLEARGLIRDREAWGGFSEALMALSRPWAKTLAQNPLKFLSQIGNLLIRLPTPAQRLQFSALATQLPDPGEAWFGEVLLAAAWKAGLAPWRSAALEALERMPEPLRQALLGPGTLEAWKAFPWTGYTGTPLMGLGGFVGFGGPFTHRPRVYKTDSGVGVASGTQGFHLVADAFGSQFLPAQPRAQTKADKAPIPSTLLPLLQARGLAPEHLDSSVVHQGAFYFTSLHHYKVFIHPLEVP